MPSGAPVQASVEVTEGDDLVYPLVLANYLGVAQNVSGWTFYPPQLRKGPGSPALIATLSVDVSQAAGGVITYSLPAAQVVSANIDEAMFDIRALDSNGKRRTLAVVSVTCNRAITAL